jgi:hypothetical protein
VRSEKSLDLVGGDLDLMLLAGSMACLHVLLALALDVLAVYVVGFYD